MIRASNQLWPKSKVVDLLSLYNFYFGQMSCSNVKFGALDGQSWLKITQSRYCAFPVVARFTADLDVRVATHHAGEHIAA